jgi:hypothetical protein
MITTPQEALMKLRRKKIEDVIARPLALGDQVAYMKSRRLKIGSINQIREDYVVIEHDTDTSKRKMERFDGAFGYNTIKLTNLPADDREVSLHADAVGQPLRVGDYVAAATGGVKTSNIVSYDIWLRLATVTKVSKKHIKIEFSDHVHPRSQDGRREIHLDPSRTVKLSQEDVTLFLITDRGLG